MSLEFEVSEEISASPEEIFHAWLDSEGHSKMTGGVAEASPEVGAEFHAWDGYIQGRNLELEPGRRILQSWRTSNFEASDPDSEIEILLEPTDGGTKVILRHTKLPPHGTQYQQGWIDHYFVPMKQYFSS